MKPLVANVPDPNRAAEIEREMMDRFTQEINAFIDERLEQFRAVNPRALLLILYKIREQGSNASAVASAFPYLRGLKKDSLDKVWDRFIDGDPEARRTFDDLNISACFILEAVNNRRIRLDSSFMRHFTDKTNWLLSPLGLLTVRADVAKLPRITIGETRSRKPSVRSQLLALGIPA